MTIDELLTGFRFPAGLVCKSAKAVVTKSVEAEVKPVADSEEHPNGEFVLILSKDNLDRDAENLWADEWMHPLPPKIHMDTDHAFAKGLSVPHTAGSGVPEIDENGDLLVKGTYAGTEHGQLTRQLVNEGHIWQASVSYQNHVMDDGRIVRELLNGTFTGVPSNPQAVVLTSKGVRSSEGSNMPTFQDIHDLAARLGATCTHCTAQKSNAPRRTKAMNRADTPAGVMARARARRFALNQNINLAVAEAESSQR